MRRESFTVFKKLREVEEKFEEVERLMSLPENISNREKFANLSKTYNELKEIVDAYREYKKLNEELKENEDLLKEEKDPEMKELIKEEIKLLQDKIEKIEYKLKVLLIPKDPNDEKGVIIEIRSGTGGEEAALFAGDLFRMYSKYVEKKGWKLDIVEANSTELGGFKEVVFMVEGKGAFSRLKYESGVHRVQRVPETEAGGRIHTSAATVAVLPEAEDVEIEINPEDLRIDVYRSMGHGGQSVNTTDSAVRITHLPTGIVVTCQDEKSQLKNRAKALKVLKARLLDMEREKQERERRDLRRVQIGSGDRSERIRTYNFPQNRVTDHRIGLTLYKLDSILEGDLDELIEPLIASDTAEKLKKVV